MTNNVIETKVLAVANFLLNFVVFLVDTGLKTSPRSWSVDDVIEFIENTDLKDFVSVFRDNVSNIQWVIDYFCVCVHNAWANESVTLTNA